MDVASGVMDAVVRYLRLTVGLPETRPLVSVVDDDESVRESLPDLLRQFGFDVRAYASAEAFLASELVSQTRCLILDVAMPGMSGPDLQQELIRRGQTTPVIFITGAGDRMVGRRLVGQGAVACLFKPFSETVIIDAVNVALRKWSNEEAG